MKKQNKNAWEIVPHGDGYWLRYGSNPKTGSMITVEEFPTYAEAQKRRDELVRTGRVGP